LAEVLILRARLSGSVSGRYRSAENFLLTKHVVAAGSFAKDPGSTPGASTILRSGRASQFKETFISLFTIKGQALIP